jgi:hypothetical protein
MQPDNTAAQLELRKLKQRKKAYSDKKKRMFKGAFGGRAKSKSPKSKKSPKESARKKTAASPAASPKAEPGAKDGAANEATELSTRPGWRERLKPHLWAFGVSMLLYFLATQLGYFRGDQQVFG